jgi:uncharacterized protein with PIN domain
VAPGVAEVGDHL